MKIKSGKITVGYTFKNRNDLVFVVISEPKENPKDCAGKQVSYLGGDGIVGVCSVKVLEFFEEVHCEN